MAHIAKFVKFDEKAFSCIIDYFHLSRNANGSTKEYLATMMETILRA